MFQTKKKPSNLSEQIRPMILTFEGSLCQRWGIPRAKRSSVAFANAVSEYHLVGRKQNVRQHHAVAKKAHIVSVCSVRRGSL